MSTWSAHLQAAIQPQNVGILRRDGAHHLVGPHEADRTAGRIDSGDRDAAAADPGDKSPGSFGSLASISPRPPGSG